MSLSSLPVFEVDSKGKYYNFGCGHRRGWLARRIVSKGPHPSRSFFYEQSYFELGNTGYRCFQNTPSEFCGAHLLRPVVSGSRPRRRARRRGSDLLPDGDRLSERRSAPPSDWLNAWITIQRATPSRISFRLPWSIGWARGRSILGSFIRFRRVWKGSEESRRQRRRSGGPMSISARTREFARAGVLRRIAAGDVRADHGTVASDTPKDRSAITCRRNGSRTDATWLAWPYDPVHFRAASRKVEQQYVRIIEELLERRDGEPRRSQRRGQGEG